VVPVTASSTGGILGKSTMEQLDESRVWSPGHLIYKAVERFGPDDLCDLISIRVVSNNDVHNVQCLQ
jgi:hypothetical protein